MGNLATGVRHQAQDLAEGFRRWRRRFKAWLPWVRRRTFNNLERKYIGLVQGLHDGIGNAASAPLQVRKACGGLQGDVCLFVTHSPRAELKTHVVHHIGHLLRAGIQVVLVVNTDLPLEQIRIAPELFERLAGVMVRGNRGFDFAAWSHALRLCDTQGWRRLFFVNDSIVGPVDAARFDAMIQRIDAGQADVIGLTENPAPVPHLQSFFLVFNRAVIESEAFERFVRGVLNFSDKAHVVDVYEVRLSHALRSAGFSTLAVFPELPNRRVASDFLDQWEALMSAGFPYVKTRVLQQFAGDPRLGDIRSLARVDDQI